MPRRRFRPTSVLPHRTAARVLIIASLCHTSSSLCGSTVFHTNPARLKAARQAQTTPQCDVRIRPSLLFTARRSTHVRCELRAGDYRHLSFTTSRVVAKKPCRRTLTSVPCLLDRQLNFGSWIPSDSMPPCKLRISSLLLAPLLISPFGEAKAQKHLKNHRYWLARYGRPNELSVAAWCDQHGVTLAVPASGPAVSDSPEARITLGSLLAPREVHVGRLNERRSECSARFEPGFFNSTNGSVDAWLARATHTGCLGHSSLMEDLTVHSNRLSITQTGTAPALDVLASCACPAEGVCTATARWEKDILDHEHLLTFDEEGGDFGQAASPPRIGGYSVNAAATVGPQQEIAVLPDHER